MKDKKKYIIPEDVLSAIINYFATELIWKDADPFIQTLRQLKILNLDELIDERNQTKTHSNAMID